MRFLLIGLLAFSVSLSALIEDRTPPAKKIDTVEAVKIGRHLCVKKARLCCRDCK